MTDKFQVGVIASAHGLQGEVNVFPTTDDPKRFKKLKKVMVDTGRGGIVEKEIEHIKFNKKFVVVKFKGWDHIEDVEKLRSSELIINRDQAYELEDGEFFSADLIGMDVVDESGKELGKITDVLRTTLANDVYELTTNDDGKTVLIPAIEDCVKNIDTDARKMIIHVMDGLM